MSVSAWKLRSDAVDAEAAAAQVDAEERQRGGGLLVELDLEAVAVEQVHAVEAGILGELVDLRQQLVVLLGEGDARRVDRGGDDASRREPRADGRAEEIVDGVGRRAAHRVGHRDRQVAATRRHRPRGCRHR